MSTSTGGGLQRAGSAISSLSDAQFERQLNELAGDDGAPASSDDAGENVAVMVRCRPPIMSQNSKETNKDGCQQQVAVSVNEEERCVGLLVDPKIGPSSASASRRSASDSAEQQVREFYFDRVFKAEANNEQVYMQSARKLVEFAFQGYNCTLFLYGQTGTGKTHTHSALTSSAFEHLFSLIKTSNEHERFLIRASYYELYNEEFRDLLASEPRKALDLRESKARNVYIKDLTCFLVSNPSELERLKRLGDKRRSTAATKMNEHSSRSHSIFSITIEKTTIETSEQQDGAANTKSSVKNQTSKRTATTTTSMKGKKEQRQPASVRLGRLHLIDLAGSERQAKSGSSGARLKEASRINLSLTCLSLVIRALTDQSSTHVPYRNSKLTRLLSSSLGGNSKTLLIACIAPEKSNLDETLNTLRFASRTKRIKNTARINEDPKDALLRKYRRQVSELRRRLLEQQQMGGRQAFDDGEALTTTAVASANDEIECQVTRKQLELLKAKIMVGGENLLDKVELHERLLEASRAELEEKKRQERRLREQLDEKRNNLEQVKQSKGSLESERQQLESRLKRAILLYKRSKLEKRDLASEHEQLKESLLQGIKATSKEIKFVDCIIEDFIPREYLDLINAYSQYDDESDEWQIKYIAMSGNNIAQTTRRGIASTTVNNPNSIGFSSTPSSASSSASTE